MSATEQSKEDLRLIHELACAAAPFLKGKRTNVKPLPEDIRELSDRELIHELVIEIRKFLHPDSTSRPLE